MAAYVLHETLSLLNLPVAVSSAFAARCWGPSGPLGGWPGSSAVQAGWEVIHRLTRNYPKPEFGIQSVNRGGVAVPVRETVIHREPFCKLRCFEAEGLRPDAATVLLVAPMSGHHATLLRDTVRALAADHRVVITDWSNARDTPLADGPFTLDDYVGSVQRFLRLLGPDRVHAMAVCQPTVPVLGAVSLMAQAGEPVPRSVILMGGPVDAGVNPTSVCRLAQTHPLSWFEKNLVHAVPWPCAGFGRRVYPGFLQHAGFVAMNPGRHWTSHEEFFMNLLRGDGESAQRHRSFYDEYNAVADLPAEYYLDTVRTVFQERALAQGSWFVGSVRVRPECWVGSALLTLEGQEDDISAPGQTHAAHRLCSGLAEARRSHWAVPGVGHYGLFSGHAWRTRIAPFVARFVAAVERGGALPRPDLG